MSNLSIIEKAHQGLTPIIEAMGYEVVDIEYKMQFKAFNLIIYIHKKGGITLDDCERVSKALDIPLDELDITGGASYNLNISSPGLDRPIVSDKDFDRNIDTEVEVSFIKNWDKKKKVNGILASYNEQSVVLNINGTDKTLPRDNISLILPYIKFNK